MRQKFITKCVRFFITKCDGYYKMRGFYYKMRCLLQIATIQLVFANNGMNAKFTL